MNKPSIDGDKIKGGIKRAMWLFMAILFIITGLGVGVYAFWQATHPANSQSSANKALTQTPTCTNDPGIQFNTASDGSKLAGAQLSNFTPVSQVTKLSCIDARVGNGAQAVSSSSTITANYTGALASTGVIFQSSIDNGGQPFNIPVNKVIQGWQQGLLGMKAGGQRRLLIPSVLAYGPKGSCEIPNPKDNTKCDKYSIPPDTDLVFDVTVLAVQ